jgi:hypothetical protein
MLHFIEQEMMSMVRFDRDTMQQLWDDQTFPCISIYLPILREGNEVAQVPIRLNTLINQAQDYLQDQCLPFPRIKKILEPAAELLDQPLFWATAQEGLAIFCSDTTAVVVSLAHPVQEKISITDHFVTRPLIEQDTSNAEYLLLAIGRGAVRIYRGSRDRLILIPVNDLPESLESVVSTYTIEKQRQHFGGVTGGGKGSSVGAVSYGVENRKDRDNIMVETYCRQVDAKITEHWQSENLPLVVASVDYLFAVYRKVSKNPNLMQVNITGSPDHLSEVELREKAWKIVSSNMPNEAAIAWGEAQNHLGSDRIRLNISQIIESANNGRVALLFIPKGKVVFGRFDSDAHKIVWPEPHEIENPYEHADLLEAAVICALQKGGKVHFIDVDRLPVGADALALMRY